MWRMGREVEGGEGEEWRFTSVPIKCGEQAARWMVGHVNIPYTF